MRPPSTTRHFTVYADYHQFYVEDAQADLIASASPNFWTAEAFDMGLAVAEDFFAVGTARYGDVKVEIEVTQDVPANDIRDWDQVNECAIRLSSGSLRVRGCTADTETAPTLNMEPGLYRARVLYANLAVDNPDAQNGDDCYRVVLWKDETAVLGERRALKSWNPESDEFVPHEAVRDDENERQS